MKQRRIPEEAAIEIAILWMAEYQTLLRYAASLASGNEHEAKDLVSRTFQAAALAWEKVRPRDSDGRRAWLRTTCRNKAIDDYRRERSLQKLHPQLLYDYGRSEPDPADVVVSQDALARCWDAFRRMPNVRQHVSRLRWIEGHSTAEISTILGISPGGVRKHLHQARLTLIKEVGPHLPFPLADPSDAPEQQEGTAT